MGTAKQLLQFDGRPLLQRVLENLRGSAVTEIILVLGHAADAISNEIDLRGLRVVTNHDYRQGMGTSLRAGLTAVDPHAEAAIIVLADQPFVKPATLNLLIEEHRRSRAQIVIPTYRGFRGNPVLLDRCVFAEIMCLGGDVGCRAIFGDHVEGIVKVPVDDAGILLDMDRKSDLEKHHSIRTRLEKENWLLETAHLSGEQTSVEDGAHPELVIVGRDNVAVALARLAKVLRFTVTVVDPLLAASELPEADQVLHVLDFSILPARSDRHVVVTSRGACDEEAIEQALKVNSAYVALVAKRKRGEEVLRALRAHGLGEEQLARVRVPAGLEIGAETAEEIALSILGEIVSMRKRPPT